MEAQVNASDWKSLSGEDQAKIQSIIASHFPDAKVAPSDGAKSSEEAIRSHLQEFSVKGAICKAA